MTAATPGWRVVADPDLCQGHQMCVLEDPDTFGFDKAADTVTVLREEPDDAARPAVEQAVKHCPAMALTIVRLPTEGL